MNKVTVRVWADGGPADGMVLDVEPHPFVATLPHPYPPRIVMFGEHRYLPRVPPRDERGYACVWWDDPNPEITAIRADMARDAARLQRG